MAERVLVTGANGFTGRYMVERLRQQGCEVLQLDARIEPGQPDQHLCDLCDREQTHRLLEQLQPDRVVHLAGIAFVGHPNIDAIYRINIVATHHLLSALAKLPRPPAKVLLASSANVYGNSLHDPIDEATPPNPANDYAVSKLAMEQMALLWCERLPIDLVRPFNYTGVGQSDCFLLPKIVNHFRQGATEIELGNLQVARDFSDVRTVVDAYARLLQVPAAATVYNVCSGHATYLSEVLQMMEEIAGYRVTVRQVKRYSRRNEVERLRGSNSRLVEAIGPLRETALQETLRWMYAAA